MAADFYEILGVPRTATQAEVRAAYVRLAKERHPDRFPDPIEKERAQEFFKELTTAFNTIFNERSRKEYDGQARHSQVKTPQEIGRESYERGMAEMQARRYFDAAELFRTAVRHEETEPAYHAALAQALVHNPHWVREGIQCLEKAQQLAPRNPAYHAQLAIILAGQGLKLRARKELEAALNLGPSNAEVVRAAQVVGAMDRTEPAPDEPRSGGGLRGLLKRKG
jgi:curved DNA-binding protein CbpA